MFKKPARLMFIMATVGAVLALGMLLLVPGVLGAEALRPAQQQWLGTWQPGPEMDSTVWGGTAGSGFARFSGQYYGATNRIYFLGGRLEDNSTTGIVFYFDLQTRTYAATGATMPTPVSNYYISPVANDGNGHGLGLYVIAGRDNAGTNINTVQVYYPQDNTVATMTADPLPVGTAVRAVGGQAVVNDKIYVFGGFSGTTMFTETYRYDPALAAGSRWTNLNCPLPSGRSYIASAVVGNKIYALGGDEYTSTLVPIADTLVLDTNNLAACWQDGAMADLPTGNGDAQAIYVPDGYLGGSAGGIFMVGGYWPTPGPYRWVFRYDMATDTWENFPQMVNFDPATGRRNYALAYVPDVVLKNGTHGLGDGVPGIWAFGGFDGSGTNAMSNTSEFFSIAPNDVLVLPDSLEATGTAGSTATHRLYLYNGTGITDTFTLEASSGVTWTTSLPASIGPVGNLSQTPFTMTIQIPGDVSCPSTSVFTVTATSQADPLGSDSQAVSVRAVCGVSGFVVDYDTGAPIENAHVWIQTDPDGLVGDGYDAYTDETGHYQMFDVNNGLYYLGASALYHQQSFYPGVWPTDTITVTVAGESMVENIALLASDLEYAVSQPFSATLAAGESVTYTLTITNNGSAELDFNLNVLDGSQPTPPSVPSGERAIPELPRIDPQIAADIQSASTGKTDFVAVLNSQADLSQAYTIRDWNARGQYVLETLRSHADASQRDLRAYLDRNGIRYTPLYIVNAVIIHGGDLTVMNSLAGRSDIAQLVANRRIAVEPLSEVSMQSVPQAPTAVGWNISQIKANQVWTTYGVRGEGIVVANVDSGVQYDHPALYRQYRGWLGGSNYDHNYNWYDPYHQGPGGGTTPADASGHGTHVMGTMVGETADLVNQIGVAPGAKWIACDGGDDVSGYLLTNELLECAQWILAPWDLAGTNPDPSKRPDVVNNSWGGALDDYWYAGAIAAWRAAGIFPAFANGNEGPECTTAHSPGDNWLAFAAGATDNTNQIADFSSRGPAALTGFMKPNISAPGANVRSSVPGSTYANYNGTSMASPHVAGAVALLWSAAPELRGQIDLSGWLLQQGAKPLYTTQGCGGDTPTSLPNNVYGYGLLDIYNAITLAKQTEVTPEWVSLSTNHGVILPGESLSVDVTLSALSGYSGTYTATLWMVAYDPVNHDVRLPITMQVPQAPSASFSSNSPVYVGEQAVFTSTVGGDGPFTYAWDFGEGGTSSDVNPVYTYTLPGTYTVTLTVTTPFGTATDTQTFVVIGYKTFMPLLTKSYPAP